LPYQNPQDSKLFKKLSIPNEIHLRKIKVAPAIERLESYIKDATNAGMKEVKVIHGRAGTGDMRRAVHKFLSEHPDVERYYPAPPAEGGPGATIAVLELSF
jgi:DNA mismatch repair protein MutS2|tara:strand:+ start:361 stop:663 length:303 start_codon:yes stop_codon:yes gene_type:complete